MESKNCSINPDFEVYILSRDSNQFCINGARYVALNNKSNYKIELSNKLNTRTDAEIWIDDINIGKWRINARDSIIIERPNDRNRKFVFVSETSDIAYSTGNIIGKETNGLIKVKFYPEKQKRRILRSRSPSPTRMITKGVRSDLYENEANEYISSSYNAGVTVLGGKTNQYFDDAERIDIDYHRVTTIMIRLVVKDNEEYAPLNRGSVYPKPIHSRK